MSNQKAAVDFFSNLRYWLAVDHLDRVRRYGLYQHFRFVFNFNARSLVIHAQRNLENLPTLNLPPGYAFRQADPSKPKELTHWIRLVNSAYPDVKVNLHEAQQHHAAHLFLDGVDSFFLLKDDTPVGTVSTGIFRQEPMYGGDARIALHPTEQGKGLGQQLVLYAMHNLRAKGVNKMEALITAHRTASLVMHFKLGFQPQFDRGRIALDIQKRMWPARILAQRRVTALYRMTAPA